MCAVAEVESTLSNYAVGCEQEAWHELLEGEIALPGSLRDPMWTCQAS